MSEKLVADVQKVAAGHLEKLYDVRLNEISNRLLDQNSATLEDMFGEIQRENVERSIQLSILIGPGDPQYDAVGLSGQVVTSLRHRKGAFEQACVDARKRAITRIMCVAFPYTVFQN